MQPQEARDLLRGIVGAARGTDDDLTLIAERCGHLPLALRSAGAYLRYHQSLAPSAYLRLLASERQRLDYLALAAADRDVRATLNLSVTLLDADDRGLAKFWRELAVFPADFLADAAAAVGGINVPDAARYLDILVSRSLLFYDSGSCRYRMHDLIRDMALESAAEINFNCIRSMHAEHYQIILRTQTMAYLRGDDQTISSLRAFDRERSNIMTGFLWASKHIVDNEKAAIIAANYTSSAELIFVRLSPRDRIAWYREGLKANFRLKDRAGTARAIGNMGIAFAQLSDWVSAIRSFEDALKLLRNSTTNTELANLFMNLSNCLRNIEQPRKALFLLESALTLLLNAGDDLPDWEFDTNEKLRLEGRILWQYWEYQGKH